MRPTSVRLPVVPLALSARNQDCGKDHAGAAAQRRRLRCRLHLLLDRNRFAGKNRLLHRHGVCTGKAQVGGHLVTCFAQHDVAGNRSHALDADALAAAHHIGVGSKHPADGVHRLFRFTFLDEADDAVGEHHRENDARVDPVTERCESGANDATRAYADTPFHDWPALDVCQILQIRQ